MKKLTKAMNLRKLEPKAKLPNPSIFEQLTPAGQQLLEQTLSTLLECVYNPAFRAAHAEKTLLEPMPDVSCEPDPATDNHDKFATDWLSPPRHKVLSADEERQLFLRFNYCRYRSMLIVKAYQGRRLSGQAARELLGWVRDSLRTRNQIVRANTSLVMAMARRTKTVGVELGELVSEGNLALLRCVDKFDCSRGFKFSTYACRAIMSGFARLGAKSTRYRAQFPAPFDPAFERSDYLEEKRADDANECVRGLKVILSSNTADLSMVERRVITARFALDGNRRPGERPRTLEQVGALLGVSKERVRQIQNRALKKLRSVIEENVLIAS